MPSSRCLLVLTAQNVSSTPVRQHPPINGPFMLLWRGSLPKTRPLSSTRPLIGYSNAHSAIGSRGRTAAPSL